MVIDADTLSAGDEILVKAGEHVPADAEILAGEASLDESLLTGESAPVNKAVGDTIFAGTIVTDAPLNCRVIEASGNTRLDQITRLVEQTLADKPPIQRLADRASAYLAIRHPGGGAGDRGRLGPSPGTHSRGPILSAVAVLVVACPCALGLATPLALVIALGRTTQAGILVRKPAALELAARVRTVVFDKTGTLTPRADVGGGYHGLRKQPAWHPSNCCVSLPAWSNTRAIPSHRRSRRRAGSHRVRRRKSASLRGLGISARVPAHGEQRVLVGSLEFLGLGGHQSLADQARARMKRGETIVWVGWDDAAAGFIALRDEPNPSARAALQQLAAESIHTVMLSVRRSRHDAAHRRRAGRGRTAPGT